MYALRRFINLNCSSSVDKVGFGCVSLTSHRRCLAVLACKLCATSLLLRCAASSFLPLAAPACCVSRIAGRTPSRILFKRRQFETEFRW